MVQQGYETATFISRWLLLENRTSGTVVDQHVVSIFDNFYVVVHGVAKPDVGLPIGCEDSVPAGRLQNQDTGVLETEFRWNLTARWALVGFGGVGRAWGSPDTFANAQTAVSEGAGFRYLIARRLGLDAGIDVASSSYGHAFYIRIGNGWR